MVGILKVKQLLLGAFNYSQFQTILPTDEIHEIKEKGGFIKIGIATTHRNILGMNYKKPPSRDLKETKECGLSFIPNVIFVNKTKIIA